MSYADNYTDEMLEELEKKIGKVYSDAQKDFERQSKEYFEKFAKRDEEYRKLVEAGEITEKEYQQWRLNQIGRGERLDKMAAQMAERATRANEVAVAYVNDATPSIYSLNRNHEAYVIEKLGYDMVGGGDFTLFNESAVRRMVVSDPDVMPYYPEERAVQRGIDLEYGQKYIKKHVTSGILQGKSVYKIADDLQKDLTNMERASAIRTARTAVTSAQNGGRQDSMNAAAKMGIKLRKRWVSAKDNRVRDAHGEADGQTVNIDEPFIVGGEEMMFPGDTSSASGWNLYNCRCAMRTVEKEGIEAEPRQIRVRNPETGKNEIVENMTYTEWAKAHGLNKAETKTERAEFTQSDKLKLSELREKYTTLEDAMFFGSEQEVLEYQRLILKERASAEEYDYRIDFDAQTISESALYGWQKPVNGDVESAISTYSRSGYTEMNGYLRHGGHIRPKTAKEIEDLTGYLSQCATQETIYLKRGMSTRRVEKYIGEAALTDISKAVGRTIQDKGFVSTTPYEGGGFGGNVIIYIKAPPGTRGAYIRRYAAAENEKEFLLDKDQTFIIRKAEKETDQWGTERYILNLEVVV